MKKLNKKAPLIALASLTAVSIIGGTMAYYQSNSEFVNKFSTSGYSSEVIELFNPNDAKDMTPGSVVNKDITVKNTGDMGLLTRIQYTQTLKKSDGTLSKSIGELNEVASDENPWIASFVEGNNFQFDSNDKYYYYVGILEPNEVAKHLDSIQLSKDFKGDKAEIKYYACKLTDENKKNIPEDYLKTLIEKEEDDGLTWINSNDCQLSSDEKSFTIKEIDATFNLEGIKKTVSCNGKEYSITAKVETIQATDIDGKQLSNINTLDDVVNSWKNLK